VLSPNGAGHFVKMVHNGIELSEDHRYDFNVVIDLYSAVRDGYQQKRESKIKE